MSACMCMFIQCIYVCTSYMNMCVCMYTLSCRIYIYVCVFSLFLYLSLYLSISLSLSLSIYIYIYIWRWEPTLGCLFKNAGNYRIRMHSYLSASSKRALRTMRARPSRMPSV